MFEDYSYFVALDLLTIYSFYDLCFEVLTLWLFGVDDVLVEVVEGDARNVLCEAVERHHATMLVVGSHGYGAIKRYSSFMLIELHIIRSNLYSITWQENLMIRVPNYLT
ncbi:putative rossmann-like alpha/beta/alpha sandwich protein [Helianthus annuus]|nr:putative rossmann-like alpha/beta/alpha sandwich protein [Helianthus annuus]